MKKKIRDLTVEELIKHCLNVDDCNSCPFNKLCNNSYWMYPRLEDLNKEIEIKEVEVDE